MLVLRLEKREWMAFAAIAAFILLFFKPVVSGDGFGYYVILEGAVRDQTLNLSKQLRYNYVANGTEVFLVSATGRYASQYAPGLPLLSAPLYAVSLFLDDFGIFHVKDEFFIRERGDILVHMAAMALTSLAIFLAGSSRYCFFAGKWVSNTVELRWAWRFSGRQSSGMLATT